MTQDRYYYPAIFTYEDGQEISVLFPDFDVATSGVDEKDAFLSARECLGVVIDGYGEDNETLPNPTKLFDIHISDNERTVITGIQSGTLL